MAGFARSHSYTLCTDCLRKYWRKLSFSWIPVAEEVAVLAETEAERAFVAHLVKAPGVTTWSQTSPSGWTASTVVGGGPGADPATIVLRKTRTMPTCQMHSVSFTNHRGIQVSLVVRTWQKPDGSWVVAPVGGGALGPSRRKKPWVNFTAGFGADGFTAGGYVEGIGSDRARVVRLIFADGFTLEDSVENGVVLFFESRGVAFPADVNILDDEERHLASCKAFDQAPFPS